METLGLHRAHVSFVFQLVIRRVRLALEPDLSPVAPAPPAASCCPRVAALPSAREATMTTATGLVRVRDSSGTGAAL